MRMPSISQQPHKFDPPLEPDLTSGKYVKIWHGPQHPGITGNMSLELTICGDEVAHCKTHVGYLHRGFEKLMERRTFIQNFPVVCRIAVPEPAFNEYLYAAAIEEIAEIEVPELAQWLRVLNLELMRLASYLMWLGGSSGSFGMTTVYQWTVTHRDYILDLFEEMTGARIYHMYITPGGVRAKLPEGFKGRVLKVMQGVEKLLYEVEKVVFNNHVFKLRSQGLGIISKDMIDEYGIVGPNQRACGFERDLRKDQPYLVYDQLDFEVVTETESDAYTRAWVRYQEMHQSVSMIRQVLDKMPEGGSFHADLPNVLHWNVPAGETYVKAECTRGEYGYYMVTDGSEYLQRIHIRGPSYTHAVSVMEKLAVGINIADVAGLMVSLHTYPPEIER
ncbi:MAG: NADH-quinone oxidoreductase subunit D [Methylococcales bacterium]|nr:NADH-quinone oxidoreductase subunit D [Methylococcales bacterium]MBT7410780.1 NADH-quinone oxidoreductase subunit D [Methylococcales bacterium]